MNESKAMATPEQMAELWHAVLAGLLGKVSKKGISAELLQAARGFLNDSSYVSPKVNSKATQRQLERLQRFYSEGLLDALGKGSPSVGLLQEARLFKAQLEQQQALEASTSQLEAIPISTPFQ